MKKSIQNFISHYIGNSSYKKNVIVMVVGRVIAQILPILISPLLTRIYTPNQFGIFGVYTAIVSFFAMISNGRFTHAIVLPKEKEKAQSIVLISCFFTVLSSIFFAIIISITRQKFVKILNIEPLSPYLFLIVISILILGLYEALFVYELRQKRFKKLALNVVIQSIVLIIIRILLGYSGLTDIGLVLSYLLGYSTSFLILLFSSDIKIDISLFKSEFRSVIVKYINFPKFNLLSDSLSTLTTYSPNVLLNKFFGADSAGHFALSEKILGSPIWFVTSSVGDVFRQEASEKYRDGKSIKETYLKTAKSMFLIGLIPFLLIFFVVPPLIPFIFGNVWTPAGDYIKIFSTMYFSSFIVNPVSNTVNIIGKQNYSVLFQGMKFVSILIAFVVGYYTNLQSGLILWSILITITNLLILLIAYRLIIESKKEIKSTKVSPLEL